MLEPGDAVPRWRLARALASRGFWLLVLAVAGCSGDRRAPPSRLLARPLSVGRPAGSGSGSTQVSATKPPLGLEAFAPLLAEPELRAASDALEAGDEARAAREVEAAMAKHPVLPEDVQSHQLLLGRLREAAGDRAGASASYELAARARGVLTGYAAFSAARALVGSGRPKDAAAWLSEVPADPPIAEDAALLRAEVAFEAGDVATAIDVWRRRLSTITSPDSAFALRFVEALLARASKPGRPAPEIDADAGEALSQVRRVLSRTSDATTTGRAQALETKCLSLLSPAVRAERAQPSAEEELERLKTLVEDRQHEAAAPLGERLLVRLGEPRRWQATGCEATVLRARALAGMKEWTAAEESLAGAVRHCTDPDLRARALYLAGKYATSTKRYVEAAQYYEKVETECPTHRLADDARLHRALCYQEIGADGRFTELLTRMPDDYPDGDMVLDGMFELAIRRIEKADWASAEGVLDRAAALSAAADAKRGLERAGRERYFRARARAALGDREAGLAEYEAIVRQLPLSYYMLHAYSRLLEADPARAGRALDAALTEARSNPFSFAHRAEFDLPGFVRALELLRVGDVADATREIDALGLSKTDAAPPVLWGIASLYARAGAAKLAHDLSGGLTDWLGRWPSGDWTRAWEIAFPRPYRALVDRESKKSAVPEPLIYAVMREESSFDPAAESPVKAYGLMQLMEPTARRFARGLPSDATALKRPAVNVAIGCRVLADLTRVFADSPLLAVPGYNAGAGRPKRWLGDRPSVDFDVWVELIPFNETRRYTKRVLSSRAAYAFLYAKDAPDAAMRLPITLATR